MLTTENFEDKLAEIIEKHPKGASQLLQANGIDAVPSVAVFKRAAADLGLKFTNDLYSLYRLGETDNGPITYQIMPMSLIEGSGDDMVQKAEKSSWDKIWGSVMATVRAADELLKKSLPQSANSDDDFYDYELGAKKPESPKQIMGLSKPVFYSGLIMVVLAITLIILKNRN